MNSINIGAAVAANGLLRGLESRGREAHRRQGVLRHSRGQPRKRIRRGLGPRIGFPIGRIVLAHNANRTVPDYLRSGAWQPRPSIATLASAMDVGNPSNMENTNSKEMRST